jgi:hypothetical protein
MGVPIGFPPPWIGFGGRAHDPSLIVNPCRRLPLFVGERVVRVLGVPVVGQAGVLLPIGPSIPAALAVRSVPLGGAGLAQRATGVLLRVGRLSCEL